MVAPLAGAGVGVGEVITGPGVVITVPLVVELQPSSHELVVLYELHVHGDGQHVSGHTTVCGQAHGQGWQAGIGLQIGAGCAHCGQLTAGAAAPALSGDVITGAGATEFWQTGQGVAGVTYDCGAGQTGGAV